LYLAELAGVWRLVGVDVGLRSLVRRLGPSRWRDRPTPDRVIDWASVKPFGGPPGQLRLAASRRELHRLRPGELADLLEQLGRAERQELLDLVDPETAADALEEMRPDELEALLRESTPERAARLVASMEPDEAADALRQLDPEERHAVLASLPADTALTLDALARYPTTTAGGSMTTRLLTSRPSDTVSTVIDRLRDERDHKSEIDSVAVVDADGILVNDVSLFDLLVADPQTLMAKLAGEQWPVTVTADQELADVVDALVAARAGSILVVDENNRPLGRILADDLVDALVPDRGRVRFPRLLS
jgi:Mg/Co/Ni transporter MgtE